MTKLHLGVVDIPYAEQPRATVRPSKGDNARTTGDVAEYLEDKYHVMEHFYQLHSEDIAKIVAESAASSLETLMMGGPATIDLNRDAVAKIETLFRKFLSGRELDQLGYPGIPTKAAIEGISHRFKGKKKGASRPSFIDTGLFEASFKSWAD